MGVRHYRLTLTAEGPVHIGTGKKFGKFDYFSHNDGIAVLDAPKFVGALNAEQVERYCQFLEGADSKTGLQSLLDDDPALRAAAAKAIAYEVDVRLAKSRSGTYQYLDVAECIKDVQGRPYVPGSSIKGMLRTALLASVVMSDRQAYRGFVDERAVTSADKNADSRLDKRVFWRECPDCDDESVVNDIMRYISVSDSEPLSVSDIVFAKKYDKFCRSDNGRHKKAMGKISNAAYYEGNELNIYREVLRPGTRIVASLDIDERVDAYLTGQNLDAEGLAKVLQDSYDLYARCFLSHFDVEQAGPDGSGPAASDGRCRYVGASGMRCRNTELEGTGYCRLHQDKASSAGQQTCTCYLGGGVDFDAKTILNALYADDEYKRLEVMSAALFAQFPSRLDPSIHANLQREIRDMGFEPRTMRAVRKGSSLKKGKDDYRHWRDPEFKVSPHTLKMGIVEGKKYPMGKCSLKIEERA